MKKKRTRSRSAIGKQSRRKGAAYERDVADKMRAVFPGARRGIGQARTGGDVPDVEGCGAWFVQTKHEARPNLWNALQQAVDDLAARAAQSHAPSPYLRPLVVARRSGDNPARDIVAMRLEDFIALVAVAACATAEAQTQRLVDNCEVEQLFHSGSNGEVKA